MAGRQIDRLAEVMGAKPPASFDHLTAKERALLAGYAQGALDRHLAAVEEAEENILRYVPGPVRGTVRKLLMGD